MWLPTRVVAHHEQGEVIVQEMIAEHLAAIEQLVDVPATTEAAPEEVKLEAPAEAPPVEAVSDKPAEASESKA